MPAILADAAAVDFTAASDSLKTVTDGLIAWVGSAMPYILAVVGSFLAFWLVKFGIRVVRSMANGSK